MSKPWVHAKSSARRYGGTPECYLDIHEFMDSSKSALADVRHRAVLHSAFGIFIVEKVFGSTRTNADGKVYSVRDIAEQHCIEDLGTIPTLERWMQGAPIEPWMMGKKEAKEVKIIPFDVPLTSNPLPSPDTVVDGLGNPHIQRSPSILNPLDWPGVIVKD